MILDYLKKILTFSPRQGANEVKTYHYIKSVLDKNKVSYLDQICPTAIQICEKASLTVDGITIKCKGVGSANAIWEGNENIISSLLDYDDIYQIDKNINFNPVCERTISMPNYFKGAALAINKGDLKQILSGKKVRAELKIKKYNFDSHNLLVGNFKTPKNIIFTHYDCWEIGAVDNASGTAILMEIVCTLPQLFKQNLFVIAGNEELSYEFPLYWGKGYRWFEKKYQKLLAQAKQLIVIDSVGHTKTELSRDPKLINLAIPLKNLKQYIKKFLIISGSIHELMKFYHAADDDLSKIQEKFLIEAMAKLVTEIKA